MFFGANYSPDMFCPHCVAAFVLAVYKAYDDWIEKERVKDDLKNAGTIISDAPIVVQASFPSNKNE